MARKTKIYFFTFPDTDQGIGFCTENRPTKEMFQTLFDSIPFIVDPEDTAKTTEAGHIKVATDTEAALKTVEWKDRHSRTVRAYHLPGITNDGLNELAYNSEPVIANGIKLSPYIQNLGQGRWRFSYKVEVSASKSIVIQSDGTLALINDVANDAIDSEDKFYGIKEGAKGFYDPLPARAAGYLKATYNSTTSKWDLSWAEIPTLANGKTYSLYAAFTPIYLSTTPTTDIMRSYVLPESLYLIGVKLRIQAVYYMAANDTNSQVYLQVSKSSGLICSTKMISVPDPDGSGYATLEAEISILSDEDDPEFLVFNGKGIDKDSKLYINHYHNWNFVADTTSVKIDFCAHRSAGTEEIRLIKSTVEIMR